SAIAQFNSGWTRAVNPNISVLPHPRLCSHLMKTGSRPDGRRDVRSGTSSGRISSKTSTGDDVIALPDGPPDGGPATKYRQQRSSRRGPAGKPRHAGAVPGI